MKLKLRFLIGAIFLLMSISFISCKTTSTNAITYSYFPEKDKVDEIFASNDFEKITSFYLFFQNDPDSNFRSDIEQRYLYFIADQFLTSIEKNSTLDIVLRNFINYWFVKYLKNLQIDKINDFDVNIQDENLIIMKKYIAAKFDKIENYYYFKALNQYINDIFPFCNLCSEVKEKKFSESKFIKNYSELSKNIVMVVSDRGIKVENGQSIPDISLGTGFFIDYDLIVTNNHVVYDEEKKGINKISVKLGSSVFKADIILEDPAYDIAFLRISYKNPDFKYFKLASQVEIGLEVIASGNPLGLSFSNTKGIVSNINREFTEIGKVIQIDAPLSPGNSGGPVFTPAFELVGIAFAGITDGQNINFILPSYFMADLLMFAFENITFSRSWAGFYFTGDKIIYQIKDNINYLVTKKINPPLLNNIFPGHFDILYNLAKKELKEIPLSKETTQTNDSNQSENSGANSENRMELITSYFPFKSSNGLLDPDSLKIEMADESRNNILLMTQRVISLLPRNTIIPVLFGNNISFFLSTRRPGYPVKAMLQSDSIDNCLEVIFNAKFVKDGDYYKFEEIYNDELSLFYGINAGDLVKVIYYQINDQQKAVVLYVSIKYRRYGSTTQNYSILVPFTQPGFF